MFFKNLFLIFLTINSNLNLIKTTHFRGGIITWKTINPSVTFPTTNVSVAITIRFYYTGIYTPCNKNQLTGSGTISCVSGCSVATSFSAGVYCDYYNLAEYWLRGERTELIDLPTTSNMEFLFSSGDWINLVGITSPSPSNWNQSFE